MSNDDIRIVNEQILSDDWFVLKKTTFDYRRRDGRWQRQSRETYDRGNGATILLYHPERRTVILTRQFRFPAYVNGLADGRLIETCAGLLDRDDPATCIRRETEEETGFRIDQVHKVFEAYMSPGSVTERVFFFVGRYAADDRVTAGGGDMQEGEDIEVLEIDFARACEMMETGEIRDGKTIMLLQYAALHDLFAPSGPARHEDGHGRQKG
jgi:nudix-type nucleoside diphosphatase (YffH/AdpP family)